MNVQTSPQESCSGKILIQTSCVWGRPESLLLGNADVPDSLWTTLSTQGLRDLLKVPKECVDSWRSAGLALVPEFLLQ